MSHCMTSVRSATQYRQIRSLIQTEAQTYRTLPLIPNTTPAFLVQQANGVVQKIVVPGLVNKAAKDWPAPTLDTYLILKPSRAAIIAIRTSPDSTIC